MSDTVTQTELELWVIEACRTLGLRVTSADDDFFEAGGSSLTAMKLISRAEEEFGEDSLDPEDLFAQSVVRDIATNIKPGNQAGTGS